MGVMRFLVHPPEALQSGDGQPVAYLSGLDGHIFPTKVEFDGTILSCRRGTSDSAKLSIPWPVPGSGRPVLTTTSLRDREEPYVLAVELARGKISEVREHCAGWEMSGMAIPDVFRGLQQDAFKGFAGCCSTQSQLAACSGRATEAIEQACRAASILVDAYTVQRLAAIRRSISHSPGLLGCVIDETARTPEASEIVRDAFNAVSVSATWTAIEPREADYHWESSDELMRWAGTERLILRAGPLVDLGPEGLPNWLSPWKNDFLNLPSFVCDFIETAVSRYLGLVRFWEVSAYGNSGGALGLGEDQRLALVARSLEAAHRTDSDAQFFIRIDRPWGEYQRHGQHRLSPFQFVDAIIRSNLGLDGVTMEINAGYGEQACLTRDMLSISRLIDVWSQLGIQLHVNLAFPANQREDPLANSHFRVQQPSGDHDWSEDAQAEWIERVVPLLLAKPAVTGVFLSQFSDAVPHRFPNAGLLDSSGRPRMMLQSLRRQLHYDLA